MNLENFSQSLHIPGNYFLGKKEFLLQKNSSIKDQSLKSVDFGPISKIFMFLKGKWKTGLNGPTKCPKFENKFKGERTATFCFCLPYCEQQCWELIWIKSEIFSQGERRSQCVE